MYNSLDIAVSGMVAQRTRLNTIAANLANQNTILDANGEPNPYQRRFTLFAPGDGAGGMGVHVESIEIHDGPPKLRWEPGSPYARPPGTPDAGYVYYPDIDPITEQIDALEAQRAYEANVQAAEAAKSMMAQALSLLA
ncbi:MAG: flagellar basal body rod protein FlgC [Phycisphaerales bacterium]